MINLEKLVEVGFTLEQATNLSSFFRNVGYLTVGTDSLKSGVVLPADKVIVIDSQDTLNETLKFRAPHIKSGFTVLITKTSIGKEGEIGKKLLEDFIYSLSNSLELPQYLIFMNEAVFLLDIESIEEEISHLRKYGVKTLVSLESLNYFKHSLNSKSAIQATSGDITEKILFSKKLINM